MTAPKKKPAAKKPAAKKPAARKPAAKKAAPAASPKLDPKEEAKAAMKAPGEIPPKPAETKSAVPGYVTDRELDNPARTALIDDFNQSFGAEFDHRMKEPKVLKNMQRRLLQQVYNK